MMEPPTKGQPHCNRCHGAGYLVVPAGETAEARLCTCVPTCPRCGGLGRVEVDRDGVRIMGRCRCQMLPDRIRLFNRAGIPARHAASTFLSFDKDVEGVAMGFIQAFGWLEAFQPGAEGSGLVLWGKVGRGKTHLAIAILRELVFRHGIEVRFVEFSRLLGLLRQGYSEGRSDAPILTELAQVPVLCIDELGKGRMTDWELQVIDDVVSRRYNALGTLLATTNYRPGEATTTGAPPNLAETAESTETLGDRVGPRVHSRLRQMCRFAEVGGPDHRALRP